MSKRRSVASHKRMKIISQLAEEVTTSGEWVGISWRVEYSVTMMAIGKKKKEKEDTFGQNDEDWHIYREIVINFLKNCCYVHV